MRTDCQPLSVLYLGARTPLATELESWLAAHLPSGLRWHQASTGPEAETVLQATSVHLVVLDGMCDENTARDRLRVVQSLTPGSARLVVTAQPQESRTLTLLRDGAHEVLALLTTPPAEACRTIARALARSGHPVPAFTSPHAHPATQSSAGKLVHDLNNLMTSINGFADLLASRMAPQDPNRPGIEHIRKAGQRAISLLAAHRSSPQSSGESATPPPAKAA